MPKLSRPQVLATLAIALALGAAVAVLARTPKFLGVQPTGRAADTATSGCSDPSATATPTETSPSPTLDRAALFRQAADQFRADEYVAVKAEEAAYADLLAKRLSEAEYFARSTSVFAEIAYAYNQFNDRLQQIPFTCRGQPHVRVLINAITAARTVWTDVSQAPTISARIPSLRKVQAVNKQYAAAEAAVEQDFAPPAIVRP